ncbi:MAG TPA: biotin/lipoyl-containing protein [Chloroflexota bacterium]|nr:biotin/lipoyl-containing protein [Chloroflexota bacterium]
MIADDVRALIDLFNSSDLNELSIEQDGRKLFLRKGEVSGAGQPAEPEPPAPPDNTAVKAHMVGIFYWTRDKAAKPAVALRQHLDKGQVVGFVEAMGIMNEVEVSQPGSVAEIAAADGQPVEYGQTLVVLEPD